MPSLVAQECSGWFGWWCLPSWQAQHEIFVKRVDRGALIACFRRRSSMLMSALSNMRSALSVWFCGKVSLTAKDGHVMHSDSANSARFLNSRWTGWPKIHQRQIFCWKDWKGHFQPFQFHGCRVRYLISCIIRLYLLVNSWKKLRSGHIWELPHATDQDWSLNMLKYLDFLWFFMIFYDFLEMMRWYMNLIPVPLASEGGEAPELFESEFWVAAVSVSRKRDFNSVPHCYAILPGGAFWKLQLARWATSTSLGVLWWFQISLMVPEHQVDWHTCMRKEPSTPYRQDICMFFFGAIEARWWWLILRLLSLSLVSSEHCHQMFTDHNVSSLSSSFCAIPP